MTKKKMLGGIQRTVYMDLWNNEIVSHSLSSRRGDRMTYISGLKDLLELKKACYDDFMDKTKPRKRDRRTEYRCSAIKDAVLELLSQTWIVRARSRRSYERVRR